MSQAYSDADKSGRRTDFKGGITLLNLPDELLLRICAELPASPAELARVARVCKRLHAITSEQVLWAALFHDTPGFTLRRDVRRHVVATDTAPGKWDGADSEWTPSRAEHATSLFRPSTWLRYAYDLLWPSALPRPGSRAPDSAIPVHYPTLYRARCVAGDEMAALGPHKVYDPSRGYGRIDEDEGDAPAALASDAAVAPNHLWLITEHTEKVYAARVRGQWAVSGSRDRTVKIWRLPDLPLDGARLTYGPELALSVAAHDASVLTLDFELDDDCVAPTPRGFMVTGSSDGTAKCWAIAWGDGARPEVQLLCTLAGAGDRVTAVAFTNDFIVTGSHDGNTRIYDRRSVYNNRELHPMHVLHSQPVSGIAVQPEGKAQAVVASTEGRWEVIDLSTGKRVCRGGDGEVAFGCVAWESIVCGGEGGMTMVYSSDGTYERTLHAPKKRLVRAIVADVDAGIVLSAGHDGQIHFARLDGDRAYRSYDFGGTPIFGMHRDGVHLVAALGDGTVAFVTYGNGLPYAGLFG